MVLYIIRHGDPDYENDSLTERGRLQAEAVGKRMFDAKIDRIFSSPMGRAKETAEPACRMLGIDMNVEEWMHEIEAEYFRTPFPDGVPKSITCVQNTYYRENGNINLPFEKSYECQGINLTRAKEAVDYIERNSNDFLNRLGYKEENGVYRIVKPNDERVAVFCHSAFAKAWISLLLHIPFHTMWSSFQYFQTGVTAIEFSNNENGVTAPMCLYFSDIAHRYKEGLDLSFEYNIFA